MSADEAKTPAPVRLDVPAPIVVPYPLFTEAELVEAEAAAEESRRRHQAAAAADATFIGKIRFLRRRLEEARARWGSGERGPDLRLVDDVETARKK